MARNASIEAFEAAKAEELKQEAEVAMARGLATVTGSYTKYTPGCVDSRTVEYQEPIGQAVGMALSEDGVMWHLLQVLQTTTSESLVARVNNLRFALAAEIGQQNALGVLEAQFGPLMEMQS
jgi:hypothetical protein